MLPAYYCICMQRPKFTCQGFISVLLFLGLQLHWIGPSLFLHLFSLTLEAKFNFSESCLHYSLSWNNPWKTREVSRVPGPLPFSATQAASETPISPPLLMLPPPAPGLSPAICPSLGGRSMANCDFKQLTSSPWNLVLKNDNIRSLNDLCLLSVPPLTFDLDFQVPLLQDQYAVLPDIFFEFFPSVF